MKYFIILSAWLLLERAAFSDEFFGTLGSECNQTEKRIWDPGASSLDEAYPPQATIDTHCTKAFTAARYSQHVDESYTLSFHDNVEVFHYFMRLKTSDLNGFKLLLRPPVLGEQRDRYIENWPYGDTLIFSTDILGFGVMWDSKILRVIASSAYQHYFQRYAGTYADTKEAIDPERNAHFDIETQAVATLLRLELDLWLIRILAEGRTLALEDDDRLIYEREYRVSADVKVFWWDGFELGARATAYRRSHNLRRDQDLRYDYEMTRYGVYIGF